MEISQIINLLKEKFGNNFDVAQVTNFIKGIDYKNLPIQDIIAKLTSSGLLDSSIAQSLKEKGASILGNKLGSLFGK